MNTPAPRSNGKPPALSEATINRLLETQARDQEIKVRELEIRQQELRAQADFAHKMLDAQVGDRAGERVHVKELQTQRFLGAGGVLLVIVGFLAYALHLGHADQVFEFAKILASALIGAFGGYGYKSHRDRQQQGQGAEDSSG